MTAPSYTSDLTTINDGSGTFTEPTSATLGTITNADTDNFIQGTSCSSKSTGASGAPALAGIGILAGAGQNIVTPQAYYAWIFTGAGALVDTYANGGIRLIVGSSSANYKMWYVLGNNTFPYVGWTCIAVDPSLAADATIGTPTGTLQYFGAVFNCLINISKGNPMALDAIRWGRVITATFGEAGNYATFAGLAAVNDTNTNRWGQLQEIPGGYQLQGKLLLGVTGGNPVDFRVSNANVVIAVSLKVAASFNAIEIQNTSSRVDLISCNISALGVVSRGTFTVTDNATVNLTGCTFTDMSTFSLLSSTVATTCVFRRTDTITTGGATLTSCAIDNNRAATAVLVSSPAHAALITGSTFTSDGSGHGLEIGGTAANLTLTGNTWIGYASSDGSTGNEAVYVNIATGSMNLTISGGTTPSVRTAGAVVTVISGAVSATVNVKNVAGSNVQNANVLLQTAAGGPFPFNATVTISNSGATATVTHTAHAMATNDKVLIKGASLQANNGVFTITKINNDSYSYTMGSTPGSNPTGTIKAWFVVLSGLTDASGNITMSRVFPSAQPVSGRVRKSSTAPYYKEASLSGSVSSSTGYTANALMISDE